MDASIAPAPVVFQFFDSLWHHKCVLSPFLSSQSGSDSQPIITEELQTYHSTASPVDPSSFTIKTDQWKECTHCLHQLFELIDQNHDGELSLDEIICLLSKVGKEVSRSCLASIMQPFDHNHDMSVNFLEFTAIYDSIYREEVEMNVNEEDTTHQREPGGVAQDVLDAFNVYDKNKDGYISAAELSEVLQNLGLREGMDLDKCQSFINRVDRDGNGLVDLQEFEAMLFKGCGISETVTRSHTSTLHSPHTPLS